MLDDDDLFRNDLRRAIATADVDDAWGSIARRVRVQRAGRTTARIGIPVLCAVALIGGVAALSNHKGSSDRPADQPTTSVRQKGCQCNQLHQEYKAKSAFPAWATRRPAL